MSKEYQIPGAFINETGTRQRQYGGSFLNETAAAETATALLFSGPSQGATGQASLNFTVQPNGFLAAPVTVTPASDGGGTFTPTSVVLDGADAIASFTYTPATAGTKTISVSNDGGLTNPASISYTAINLPVGFITEQTVVGQTVTLSGTVTGTPSSGSATLPVVSGGVEQGPTAVTLGAGTWSLEWSDIPPGEYGAPVVTFTNVVGTGPVATGGDAVSILGIDGDVTEPDGLTAAITSQALVVDELTLSGTYSGDPTDATASITPTSGGAAQGPLAVSFASGSWSVVFSDLITGDYAAPEVEFTDGVDTVAATGGSTFSVVVAPTAAVTSQSVTGGTLTISGTYTGVPDSATITLTPTSGGAPKGPQAVTFGSGTWSATVTNIVGGSYAAPVVTFTNTGGAANATGATTFSVVPAPTAAITGQTVTGTTLNLSGTYTGTPTSATAMVTPTSDGGEQGPTAVTYSGGTWNVEFTNLVAGNYAAPVVTFTNATGSSNATGGTTFSVESAVPLTAAITNQNLVDDDLTVTGTYTGTPTSATAEIAAIVDGASQTGVTVTFGGGTWTAVFSNLVPGEYSSPVVTFTNAQGPEVATGGSAVTVLDIQGPAATVSITAASIALRSISASGNVNLQGDINGTIMATVQSVPSGTTLGPVSLSDVAGTWSYQSPNLNAGQWKLVISATANENLPTVVESSVFTVLGLTGTKVLPIPE